MKKVGLLGGSFDPIHFGHINLALEVKEKKALDEVWWIPAQQNPLKKRAYASAKDRLCMLELSLKDIPFFKVIDYEIQNSGPSYSVDTVRYLKEKQSADYYFILGSDVLESLHFWKSPEELFSLVKPLIATRPGEELKPLGDWQTLPIRPFDISSTEIRARVKKGQYVGHLVPAAALDYIYKHKLY